MPTYTVFSVAGHLLSGQRERIAARITSAHCGATGAPSYFAQVIFLDVPQNRYFVGGAPLGGRQVFVQGQIRDGRSAETKAALIEAILEGVAEAAELPRGSVWCYLVDLPSGQMAEFGRILPRAGEEAAWSAALPQEERTRLEAIGRAGT